MARGRGVCRRLAAATEDGILNPRLIMLPLNNHVNGTAGKRRSHVAMRKAILLMLLAVVSSSAVSGFRRAQRLLLEDHQINYKRYAIRYTRRGDEYHDASRHRLGNAHAVKPTPDEKCGDEKCDGGHYDAQHPASIAKSALALIWPLQLINAFNAVYCQSELCRTDGGVGHEYLFEGAISAYLARVLGGG